MADIFVSYSSHDRERIRPLVAALEEQGWSVWWDREIRPGTSFDDMIDKAIVGAGCVVVVWTESSIQSDWVRTEALEGLERDILVPVLLDDIRIPLAFRRIQAARLIAWPDSDEGEFARMIAGIGDTLDAAPLILPAKPEELSSDKPGFSVAVLALNNLSDDRELDWIASGLAEDIITRLGMVHFLNVTARNSSFALTGQTPDIREVGRTLNVRYIVEGSIRKIDDILRVTAQLIDTDTGGHIWSENYDHPKSNLRGMQDAVVDIVSGEVLSTILNTELDRFMTLTREDLSVQDIVAIGWGKAVRTRSAEGTVEAVELVKDGLRRFPEAAELHAELAFYTCLIALWQDQEGRQDLLSEVEYHLAQAIRIAPRASMTLWRQAGIRNLLGQYDEALLIGEQLEKLHPNDRLAPILSDTYRVFGRYDEALNTADRWLETGGTVHFDRPMILGFKGDSLLGSGAFASAEAAYQEAISAPPVPNLQLGLIVSLAHQGKLETASAEVKIYKTLQNARSLEGIEKFLHRHSKDPTWIETYLEGLRLAGLE